MPGLYLLMYIERVPNDSTSLLHGNIDAADDRSDQHHRDDADDHAKDSQERTQLVGEQRGQRHPQIFVNVVAYDVSLVLTSIDSLISPLCSASIGSSRAAFQAGKIPDRIPRPPEAASAPRIATMR